MRENAVLFQELSVIISRHIEGAARPRPHRLNDFLRINRPEIKRWLHNFGRGGKWNFCLTTGTLVPANQERR